MKKTFALLLSALVALGAAACGGDRTAADLENSVTPTAPATGVTPDSAAPDRGGSASDSILPDRAEGGASTGTGDELTGGTDFDASAGTGAAWTDELTDSDAARKADSARPSGGESARQQHSVIRGATYGQMLRNAHVHDRDGFLLDGENAVTPGADLR